MFDHIDRIQGPPPSTAGLPFSPTDAADAVLSVAPIPAAQSTARRGHDVEYTPDIASFPDDLRAHWFAPHPWRPTQETVMTTPKLHLISFGSVKALTRDGEIGPYFELQIVQSRTPA